MQSWTVRSFTDEARLGGNRVLVLLFDEPVPDAQERQRIATATGEPATVFVHADRRRVNVHNRASERRLIGHALLGACEALASIGPSPDLFSLPVGDVPLWTGEDGMRWLHAPSAWSPNDRHRQVATADEVADLGGPPADEPVQVWAWIDEDAGTVRARQFAPSQGKPEDEACGSGCMVLADKLGRDLTVRHGKNSLIRARPNNGGVDLGGYCILD